MNEHFLATPTPSTNTAFRRGGEAVPEDPPPPRQPAQHLSSAPNPSTPAHHLQVTPLLTSTAGRRSHEEPDAGVARSKHAAPPLAPSPPRPARGARGTRPQNLLLEHPQNLHGEARARRIAAKPESGDQKPSKDRHLCRHDLAQATKSQQIRGSAGTHHQTPTNDASEDLAGVGKRHLHQKSTATPPLPPGRRR